MKDNDGIYMKTIKNDASTLIYSSLETEGTYHLVGFGCSAAQLVDQLLLLSLQKQL